MKEAYDGPVDEVVQPTQMFKTPAEAMTEAYEGPVDDVVQPTQMFKTPAEND